MKPILGVSLTHMTPKNVIEAHELFFENDCKINPQFEYINYSMTQKNMESHNKPREKLLKLAVKILESFLEIYGSESCYLETEGDILS